MRVCHHDPTALELPGVYDGTAAWICFECKVWAHRFGLGDPKRAKTEYVMKTDPEFKDWKEVEATKE